jgi:hypothetical protein
MKADTIIISAIHFKDYLFCLQNNNKIFVLDTNLNLVGNLTNKVSALKASSLHVLHDTAFIWTDKNLYFLDSNFRIGKYTMNSLENYLPNYGDSLYHVYSCSAGEFGGAVFFLNKKTRKTYSYPATDVQQVLKFQDTYIISSFLAHLGGFSDYLFIKDPAKLYELKDEKQKHYCNWYMEDTIKGVKQFDDTTMPGVRYYSSPYRARTLVTFPYKNNLYSIYSTDSATILTKHRNNKFYTVDTLLTRRLYFHNATTQLFKNGSTTAYWATWARGGEGATYTHFQNTGLIFILNNHIKILEFQTPHMETGNNNR